MVPARVALALQADGWYLRSKPPWIKPGCAMPESVTLSLSKRDACAGLRQAQADATNTSVTLSLSKRDAYSPEGAAGPGVCSCAIRAASVWSACARDAIAL